MGRRHVDVPVPALALRRAEAAAALGVSVELFDEHVRPELPVIRVAGVVAYPRVRPPGVARAPRRAARIHVPTKEGRVSDRQITRWREARVRLHEAQQAHREATRELEVAAVELSTAGSALAERLLLQSDAAPTFASTALPGAKHARPVRALRSADGVEHPHNHEHGAPHAR